MKRASGFVRSEACTAAALLRTGLNLGIGSLAFAVTPHEHSGNVCAIHRFDLERCHTAVPAD